MEYKVFIVNKHLLLENGQGLLLVDTGSPTSLHRDGYIDIAGARHDNVPQSCIGVSTQYLTEKVGVEVAGLLGMDIMIGYQVRIDLPNGAISFEKLDNVLPQCRQVERFNMMGIPGIVATVKGRTARLLFDIGAPVSYMGNGFLAGTPVVDTVEDFSPLTGGGSYSVDLHMLNTELAGEEFEVAYGGMPPTIAMLLNAYGVDGIIGYDLMERYCVVIDAGDFRFPVQ